MKPSKRDIKKWINALRSGEYPQTRGALQDDVGYCCLGVACALFIPVEDQQKDFLSFLAGAIPADQIWAPRWLKNIERNFDSQTETLLATLNDDHKLTFDEIADVLQAVYIEEVLS